MEELICKPGAIPSLPTVYYHIQRIVNDPDATFEKIVEIIGEDPALTVRLLRLANSSFYGFPQQINTLDEAVRLIGLKQVRDLCLGTVMLDLFSRSKIDPHFMEDFWKHSIACGIGSRLISQYRRQKNAEQFFVMGLIHDIGKLMMAVRVPEKFETILLEVRDSGLPMFEVERKHLGCDHCRVGERMLLEWKMPDTMIQVVKGHHDPKALADGSQEVSIVHLSNLLVHALEIGSGGEIGVPPFEEKVWEKMGLQIEMLPGICEEIDRQFLEVERIFLGS